MSDKCNINKANDNNAHQTIVDEVCNNNLNLIAKAIGEENKLHMARLRAEMKEDNGNEYCPLKVSQTALPLGPEIPGQEEYIMRN
jgi:hypothetical protein